MREEYRDEKKFWKGIIFMFFKQDSTFVFDYIYILLLYLFEKLFFSLLHEKYFYSKKLRYCLNFLANLNFSKLFIILSNFDK